jgi:hypothetical protein
MVVPKISVVEIGKIAREPLRNHSMYSGWTLKAPGPLKGTSLKKEECGASDALMPWFAGSVCEPECRVSSVDATGWTSSTWPNAKFAAAKILANETNHLLVMGSPLPTPVEIVVPLSR